MGECSCIKVDNKIECKISNVSDNQVNNNKQTYDGVITIGELTWLKNLLTLQR